MATFPNNVDEIRREMAEIRRELHKDVKEVAATAAAATDWHQYLTRYPWITLSTAFGLGFFLVPSRQRTTKADLSKIRRIVESTDKRLTESTQAQEEPVKTREKSLAAAALGMVVPLALRAAQGYALKYLEQWIMQQHTTTHQVGPRPVQPTHPGGSGSERPTHDPRRGGGPGTV